MACHLASGQNALPHRLCSRWKCSLCARARTRWNNPWRTSLWPLATQLVIICCTRCKIMTYMTVKEHAICILAARLMFIAWFCSLRAGKIALGLGSRRPKTRHPAAPPFADCAIIYAAALYTSTLYGTVLNCLGHHARDVKTPCLDILSTLMWCSAYIQCVCVIVHCQLIGNNYSYLWLFLH